MGTTRAEISKPGGQDRDEAMHYKRVWATYARRRTLALFLVFGFLPVCVAALLASEVWLHDPLGCVAICLVWWVAMCLAIWWAGEVRCPRCRRRFGAIGSRKGVATFWRGLFDKVCGNCKLRRWEQG